MEKQHPLIIVFYLAADMMSQPNIIQPFAESVNHMLLTKEANALAFFIPTKGEERIECINPAIVEAADMDKIMNIVKDLTESFNVGEEIPVPDTDIESDVKCDCGDKLMTDCDCGPTT